MRYDGQNKEEKNVDCFKESLENPVDKISMLTCINHGVKILEPIKILLELLIPFLISL